MVQGLLNSRISLLSHHNLFRLSKSHLLAVQPLLSESAPRPVESPVHFASALVRDGLVWLKCLQQTKSIWALPCLMYSIFLLVVGLGGFLLLFLFCCWWQSDLGFLGFVCSVGLVFVCFCFGGLGFLLLLLGLVFFWWGGLLLFFSVFLF